MVSSSGRRLTRSSASAMVLREVSASHKLTINGCKPSKNLHKYRAWDSKPFHVGRQSWRIRYYPHGPGHKDSRHISFYLEIDGSNAIETADDVTFKFSVLDQSGNPVPEFTRATTEPCCFNSYSPCQGFTDFVTWEDLEESGCLKDDTFTVQCDLTYTTDLGSPTSVALPPAATAAAPSKLHEHLADLLWKHKHGADATVDVGSEATFDAHGWVLADRSPIFKAELELLAASNSKKTAAGGGTHRRSIVIEGVDPKVFEAVLQYMYTNALPEMMKDGDDHDAMATMAEGLLAAADRFKLDGLKLTCEEALSKRVDVSTAAWILAVAEQHGCKALKAACVEFLSPPEKMKAVMETEGYEKVRAIVHPIVVEVAVKQYLLMSDHK
ncbi:unnamed protein product [Urochloa decumbens]|uniref:BTB domain-containing protein n=1 Tax=Urochloa decumbens TaxID=240449 RepID=A0ABC8WAD8_9POAL